MRGQVAMLPAHPSGLMSTVESAAFAGVKPVTIRQWRRRGWLAPQGLDERGYPMHSREAVRTAEQLVRENGLGTSGIDPRQQRKRAALGYPRAGPRFPLPDVPHPELVAIQRPTAADITLAAAVFGWLPDPTTGSGPSSDRVEHGHSAASTCSFPLDGPCIPVSSHALAVTLIIAADVLGGGRVPVPRAPSAPAA